MKSFCVVRFKCTGPLAVSQDNTRRPSVPKGADESKNTKDESSATATAIASSVDLPLARLCKDKNALTGKEIRLVFLRGNTTGLKRGTWVWSMIVDLLTGRGHKFAYNNVEANKGSLDTWAASLPRGR